MRAHSFSMRALRHKGTRALDFHLPTQKRLSQTEDTRERALGANLIPSIVYLFTPIVMSRGTQQL